MSRRPGISLVELCTVIAIVIILASVTLPAVLRVRESSRKTMCQSNLHQIGLLAHEYHSLHGHILNPGFLRPMIKQIDPNLEEFLQIRHDPLQIPHWNPPNIFLCPSDDFHVPADSRYSYAINAGSKVLFHDGILSPYKHQQAKFSQITDGLSNTALSCEVLFRLYATSPTLREAPSRGTHGLLRHYAIGEEDDLLHDAIQIKTTGQFLAGGGGPADSLGVTFRESSEINYNHVGPPNEWSFDSRKTLPGMRPPSSLHSGGVFCLMADGHVRFVSNNVDLIVWRATGSIDGHESQSLND